MKPFVLTLGAAFAALDSDVLSGLDIFLSDKEPFDFEAWMKKWGL